MIVVVDKGLDLSLKVAGQEVILQQDAVLQRLVPAFHCPAVDCTAINERGSYPAFWDDMVRHENASCPCRAAIQPGHQRCNWNHCR